MRVIELACSEKVDWGGIDEHIGGLHQAPKQRLALAVVEIERDALFVDVVMPKVQAAFRVWPIVDKRPNLAGGIAAGRLNFDDFCPVGRKQLATKRRFLVGNFLSVRLAERAVS